MVGCSGVFCRATPLSPRKLPDARRSRIDEAPFLHSRAVPRLSKTLHECGKFMARLCNYPSCRARDHWSSRLVCLCCDAMEEVPILLLRVRREAGTVSGGCGDSQTIQRILELSADAQIARRRAAKDSPAFHTLTVAIAAYGKVLALLVALQRAGKNSPHFIAQPEVPQSDGGPRAALPRPFTSSLLKQTSASSSN